LALGLVAFIFAANFEKKLYHQQEQIRF